MLPSALSECLGNNLCNRELCWKMLYPVRLVPLHHFQGERQRMRYRAVVLGLSLLLSLPAFAQEDSEGCKDSPLIQRMPGSTISTCEHKEFDSVEMPVGKNAGGDPVTKNIEGEVWSWSMSNREGLSDVQVYRNFLNALQKAAWTLDFQNPNLQITAHKGSDYVFMD